MSEKLYDEQSIQSLDPREHVRLRPGMYVGDTQDPTQLLVEILGNSIDEYQIGHGNFIEVTVQKDGTVRVLDNGQGFLVNSVREDGETILQASFDVTNTSGKFSDDGVYEGTAIGLNGLGSKLTNFLSSWLNVTTWRDGEFESIQFKDGVFVNRQLGKCDSSKHGTEVSFLPDPQFFTNPKVNLTKISRFADEITCFCPGLTIKINETSYSHEDGIGDFLASKKGKAIELSQPLIYNAKRGKQKISLGLVYTDSSTSSIITYVNCGLTDAGPHITAIKSCITRTLNKWAKENGLLKPKEKGLEGSALQEGLVLVTNITSNSVAYNAQVKTTITSIETSFISESLGKELERWLDNHPEDGKSIIEKALVARKAAEAAKKARAAVKAKAQPKTKLRIAAMPTKLADCHSKSRLNCELYLTEGDSASGGAKTIRDAKTQAIMPLRGKVLNCKTASLASIHKNNEIMNIIQALGLKWSADGKQVIYNKQDLRYGKVIIAADRDSDGDHIQSLLLTMFWTLIPDLILDGYVYIALAPLYKAEWGTQYKYLENKSELEEFKKTHSNFTLSYFKGLGEASPDELGRMIIFPETRHLEKVVVEKAEDVDKVFEELMGSSSVPKKHFVFGNAIADIL